MERVKPIPIIMVGVLNILSGLGLFITALIFMFVGILLLSGAGSRIVGLMIGAKGFGLFLFSILWTASGIGLVNLRRWARICVIITMIAVTPLAIMFSLKQASYIALLSICILYLVFFNHPKIKEQF